MTFAGVNGTPERAFATDVNNIGPRVGFAYRLGGSDRTVLRGGAGVFYGQTVDATIGDTASLGFSTQASFVVAQAGDPERVPSARRIPCVCPRAARRRLRRRATLGDRPYLAVSFFNPNQKAPTSYQSNIDLQHQLNSGLLLEVGYIGNEGRHLTGPDITLDQVPADRLTSGNTQLVRPFPQFSNVTWINPSIGRSSYHGVFFRAQKRFSDAFSVLGHYTWSRYLDDVGASSAADDYGSGAGSYQDAYNRQADWARSGDDVPHRLVVTVLYEVPTFSRNRMIDAALAHWRIGVLRDRAVGPGVHGDEHHEPDERVSGRRGPTESRRRSRVAVGSANVDAVVQHRGVCESGAVDVWEFAALGVAWTVVRHDRPDARKSDRAVGSS